MDQDTAISKNKRQNTDKQMHLFTAHKLDEHFCWHTLTHPARCFLKAAQLTWANAPSLLPLHYWMAHETLPPISSVCIMSRNCLFLLCAFAVGLEFSFRLLSDVTGNKHATRISPVHFFFVLFLYYDYYLNFYVTHIYHSSSLGPQDLPL